MEMRKVLNVGGNSKEFPLPQMYAGWQHVWLDIDPAVKPDVLCDARDLTRLPAASYDAVYCSHNLEHYFRHDVPKVLAGFLHVLKAEGFVHIVVPDIGQLMRQVVENRQDLDDVIFIASGKPITVLDVVYGLGSEIEQSGNDFFAHKTGFTQKSLPAMLDRCGFRHIYSGGAELEIVAYAFKTQPDDFSRRLLRLP
jgi:SAM-dependent methyltransferase